MFVAVLHLGNIYGHQVGYWLVTVRTYGDFIMMPHWETAPSASLPNIPTLSKPVLAPVLVTLSARLGSGKYQFCKSLIWLDRVFKHPTSCKGSQRFTDCVIHHVRPLVSDILTRGLFSHIHTIWKSMACDSYLQLGAVAESVRLGARLWDIGSSLLSWVKPITYKLDNCCFQPWCLTLTRIEQESVRSVSR